MCFPSATLIRLYEFLKNSRGDLAITCQSMDINQHQNILNQTGQDALMWIYQTRTSPKQRCFGGG
jgi:hypothetical protein